MSERDGIEFFLELETYKVGTYQNSVRHRHYYQLSSCVIESEIDELGFYQNLRVKNRILFRVGDI